jgi:hypothetical protein
MLGRIRKALGYYKWYFLQGGRKKSAYQREALRMQKQSERELPRLKPITIPEQSETEVHIFCGTKQAVMAIWSLWSFYHFAGADYAAFVHSDGTLSGEDAERFRKFFPGIHIVDLAWAEQRFQSVLAGPEFARTRQFRDEEFFGRKLLHPHLSEHGKVIFLLDTDILFFGRPTEVIDSFTRAITLGQAAAGLDVRNSYVADPQIIRERLGVKIADRLNCGMMVVPKFTRDDFLLIERSLRGFDPEWFKSYFPEQTLDAIVAGERGWTPFSDRYPVGRGDPERSIAIHYASGLRQRMFTEGVPRLLAIAEGKGQPIRE